MIAPIAGGFSTCLPTDNGLNVGTDRQRMDRERKRSTKSKKAIIRQVMQIAGKAFLVYFCSEPPILGAIAIEDTE